MYNNAGNRNQTGKQKSSFQRYFEGYSEVRSVNPDGSVRVDMVYTAPYWVHDLSDKQWKLQKYRFLGLTGLILVLYLCAAFMPLGGEYSKFIMLPGGITAAILVFLVTYTCTYLFCPRKMTIYDYNRNHAAMRRWPFAAAIGLTAAGIMSLVYIFVSKGDQLLKTVIAAACYFAAAMVAFVIYRTEDKTEYFEEENGYAAYSSY